MPTTLCNMKNSLTFICVAGSHYIFWYFDETRGRFWSSETAEFFAYDVLILWDSSAVNTDFTREC